MSAPRLRPVPRGVRRRAVAAIAALAVAILALAWPPVRGPHSSRAAAVAPAGVPGSAPSPQERRRREAAIALAREPGDDPWTFAERTAPASAASAADPPRDRCGGDERPSYVGQPDAPSSDPADEGRAAGPHYAAATRRIDAALRASADPFDRAVADWLDVGDTRSPDERLCALVDDAIATADPRVYALAYRTCRVHRDASVGDRCEALSARRWAEIDFGNALPWIYAFAQAQDAGDASAQQEALAHLAAADRFEDRAAAAAGAVAGRVADDDAVLAAGADLAARAMGMSAIGIAPVSALLRACRDDGDDPNVGQACGAAARRMFERSDSLFLQATGGALYAQATGDGSLRDAAQRERDALAPHWMPGTGFSECGVAREILRKFRREAEVGELQAVRERLREPLPP